MDTNRSQVSSDSRDTISRRDFGKGSAGLLLAAGITASRGANAASETRPRRYAIVGVGHRSHLYQTAIHKTYGDHLELVGAADVNMGRLHVASEFARKNGREPPKLYLAHDFDKMVAETKPEVVIVTTVDGFHHEYICRAMQLGCDALTEKPLTIDAEKCKQILDTRRSTGRRLRVAFNYRYTPVRTQVKELLMSGTIGDVLSVDFHWMLDTHHGADYFRRWHSQKKLSGGLMVHKATHHFDLVNWWLSAIPVSVRATGKRDFYTPAMAKRLGLTGPHERCRTCPEKSKCAFELDISKVEELKTLYLDNEQYDGYFRDRCVFRPDIDIEDTMNLAVTYDNDVSMSYSLNAFTGWEGYVIVFNGTKGRLEHKMEEAVMLGADAKTPSNSTLKGDGTYIRVYPMRKPAYQVPARTSEGGHGGGDEVMLADLFAPNRPADPTLRAADERSGAYSILTGIAANHCFLTGQTTKIADLVPNIGRPDYPTMPSHLAALGMPPKV
jgi:predicted dehydrogenase